jgi:hypothetical protein
MVAFAIIVIFRAISAGHFTPSLGLGNRVATERVGSTLVSIGIINELPTFRDVLYLTRASR